MAYVANRNGRLSRVAGKSAPVSTPASTPVSTSAKPAPNGKGEILPDLLAARVEELERQLAEARASKSARGRISVTADGRKVSVYHGGRFPITAYREQWQIILDNAAEIQRLVNTLPFKAGQ